MLTAADGPYDEKCDEGGTNEHPGEAHQKKREKLNTPTV
jgi:hypothetical protein